MIARTPNQHENNFPNKVKASQEQMLGSEGRNESKRAGVMGVTVKNMNRKVKNLSKDF